VAKLGHSRFPRRKERILADYPCDLHNSRYHGPSNRVYLNAYREELEIRLKISVCSDCLAVCLADWGARALLQDDKGVWNPQDGDLDVETLWRPSAAPTGRANGYVRR
jgi:hypothetical protein